MSWSLNVEKKCVGERSGGKEGNPGRYERLELYEPFVAEAWCSW